MGIVSSTIIAPSTVTIVDSETPKTIVSADALVTSPNATISVLSGTVPLGKKWKIRRVSAQCRAQGNFSVKKNGSKIGKILTSSASENPNLIFDPYYIANAGDIILVEFTQSQGASVDIAATLQFTEN